MRRFRQRINEHERATNVSTVTKQADSAAEKETLFVLALVLVLLSSGELAY